MATAIINAVNIGVYVSQYGIYDRLVRAWSHERAHEARAGSVTCSASVSVRDTRRRAFRRLVSPAAEGALPMAMMWTAACYGASIETKKAARMMNDDIHISINAPLLGGDGEDEPESLPVSSPTPVEETLQEPVLQEESQYHETPVSSDRQQHEIVILIPEENSLQEAPEEPQAPQGRGLGLGRAFLAAIGITWSRILTILIIIGFIIDQFPVLLDIAEALYTTRPANIPNMIIKSLRSLKWTWSMTYMLATAIASMASGIRLTGNVKRFLNSYLSSLYEALQRPE
ncbi:hypothetical protein J5N97_012290 [Dioscorea zingiberensis]|uniref:Uncharacterized protein n=1 Tax=Dioscorea zingiberensis TaxID=325984 RepID=A0A9D5HHK0_9LILI|nr:hypothetical protein J5N97_012290 [Dioscorea zingiberensis]